MMDPNAPTPAEQLARLWHSIGMEQGRIYFPEHYGEDGDRIRLPWDELTDRTKNYLIAIGTEIITVLLEGKIIEYDDPGDKLAMLLGKTEDGKVRVDFQKPLKWFAMTPDAAISFALTILQHCGIPVQVNIAPAPGAPETGKPV
jgi:hypothetical protein